MKAVIIAFLAAAIDVAAHHSFAAVYDQNEPLRVEGTVQRIEWRNPHGTMALIGQANGEGPEAEWVFEMGAPMVLLNQFGWRGDTVKVGDRITFEGFHARSGGQQPAAVSVVTRFGARLRAVRPFR
jgi:hypothetical protein